MKYLMFSMVLLGFLSGCCKTKTEPRLKTCNPQLAYKCYPPIIEPHPRDVEERERERRQDDPSNKQKREILDESNPERAPHDEDEAENLALDSGENQKDWKDIILS